MLHPKCKVTGTRDFKTLQLLQWGHAWIIYYTHSAFTHLISGKACALFSCIFIDTVPLHLAEQRQNSTRQWYVLAVLYMLTNCEEFLLYDNMREDTIIFKLLRLRGRYQPIHYIATNRGSNLMDLEMSGKYKGGPLRVLCLLKQAKKCSSI